jgi:hypothetical protein
LLPNNYNGLFRTHPSPLIVPHGLRKPKLVKEPHKSDHIAPCAAPEALPKVGFEIDRKGLKRLFKSCKEPKLDFEPKMLIILD